MLDKYYFGKVDRISPEAPVPIVNIQKEESRQQHCQSGRT